MFVDAISALRTRALRECITELGCSRVRSGRTLALALALLVLVLLALAFAR